MHLAAIKSVLHALEALDLLSGQGGQILLGTQRAEHTENGFKPESFVHPLKQKAAPILPCNFALQRETHKSNRQCSKLKGSHFSDYSVNRINSNPKTPPPVPGGIGPAELALEAAPALLWEPAGELAAASCPLPFPGSPHRAAGTAPAHGAWHISCHQHCRARPGMARGGRSYPGC